MKKYLTLIIAILALAAAGYVVYLGMSQIPNIRLKMDRLMGTTPAVVANIPHYIDNKENDSSMAKIDLEQTGIVSIDARVNAEVDQRVSRFIAEAENNFTTIPEEFKSSAKWSVTWNGKIASQAGKIINYRLDGYRYTGGAHGSPAVVTYVWDTADLQSPPSPVDISSVFVYGSEWLQRLSSVSGELLLAGKQVRPGTTDILDDSDRYVFSAEGIAGGTTPDYSNFLRFSLEHSGIRIIFDSYQIGPFAIGQPEVIIPWDRVKDLVSPDLLEKVHSE